jgi:hypothetical protein
VERAGGRIVEKRDIGDRLDVIQEPRCSRSKSEIIVSYLKPPVCTRLLANPLAMRLNARGVATLTLAGRRTGDARKVPVIPVEVGGSRYQVSPYGESDWSAAALLAPPPERGPSPLAFHGRLAGKMTLRHSAVTMR